MAEVLLLFALPLLALLLFVLWLGSVVRRREPGTVHDETREGL